MVRIRIAAIICLSAVLGCAGRSPSSLGPREAVRDARRGTREWAALGADEITTSGASTAYDAVNKLRPNFLRSRGPSHAVTVVIDNMARGTVDDLRRIPISNVAEIRHLDGRAATQLYGTGYTGGVIAVLTKTGPGAK